MITLKFYVIKDWDFVHYKNHKITTVKTWKQLSWKTFTPRLTLNIVASVTVLYSPNIIKVCSILIF